MFNLIKMGFTIVLLAISMLLTSVTFGADAVKPTIFAYVGAGLKEPVSELARLYQEKNGVKIEMTFNNSGALLSQLDLVKKGDIYMPGAMSFMEKARQRGHIMKIAGPIAYHVPVIITPKGNPAQIKGIDDLAKPGVRLILPDKEATALGKTAFRIFTKLGIVGQIEKNLLAYVETAPKVITTISLRQGDAGIAEYSEGYKARERLEVILIDPKINETEELPCAILNCTTQKEVAEAFMNYVKIEGPAVFAKHGFKIKL